MSTWYYLVCDRHKVYSHILGGRSFPDRWWMQEDRNGALADFLEAHNACKPVLVSEADERTWNDEDTGYKEFPEWDYENDRPKTATVPGERKTQWRLDSQTISR